MRGYFQTEPEQARLEQSLLRQHLEVHFTDIADILEGYRALWHLLEVPKTDPSLVTSELNGYYRDIVKILTDALSYIYFTIAKGYDTDSKDDLPSFHVNTKIFGDYLYFPLDRLFIDTPILWSDVEKAYDECWDRIQQAYLDILDGQEVVPEHQSLFLTAIEAAKKAIQLPEINGLKVDFKLGTIQYQDAKPIQVGAQRNEMLFFRLLLQNKGRVVPYELIAKELDLSFYHEGLTTKEIAENLRYLKNDLGKLLKTAGMSKEVFANLITSQPGTGYILQSE